LADFPLIKAIIFDFGRVISAQKPVSLFRSYERDLGLAPGTINQIMFESQAWQDALVGRLSTAEFWDAIGPALGLESHRKIDEFRRRYHADESIDRGVLNLIRQLHENYKLAVLSNNPPGLTDWLSDWEILDLFDVVFCSGDEGMAKPDPAVYNVTLKRMGTLSHETIFIDDTIGHVKTAQSLGMHGILFTESELLRMELNRLLAMHSNGQTKEAPLLP
jgi:putative hydrolase of the HAD superfamily